MTQFNFLRNTITSNYAVPEVVNADGMRQYRLEGELYPSVTSILSRQPSPGLDSWRNRVGKEVASHICKTAVNRGTTYHKICENYLQNNCICRFENHLLEYNMFKRARSALDRISDIVAIEFPMVSQEFRFGGTADIVAKFDSVDNDGGRCPQLAIIDLKSSTSPKRLEWCTKFFLQECAYSLAYEEITAQPIEKLVTIIASEDGTIQVLVKDRDDYVDELKKIISEFHGGALQNV